MQTGHESTPTAASDKTLGVSTQQLLERFTAASHVEYDLVSARRAVVDAFAHREHDAVERPVQRLGRAARNLGLRVEPVALSVREAAETVAMRGPIATCLTNEPEARWVVVVGRRGRSVDVLCGDGSTKSVSTKELARLLGTDHDAGSLLWASAQIALPCGVAESADSHSDGEHAHPGPLARLYRLLRPEASDIAITFVFAVAIGLLGLATPVAVEALVNTVAFGRFMQPVVVLSALLFGFLGFAAVLKGLQAYVSEIIQRRIFARVVSDLAYRLPRVKQAALDGHHGPELINRFFDVMTVQKSAALLVLDGIAIVIQTLIGMAVLAMYHPYLLGFDLLLLASLAFAIFVLGRGAVRTAIAESKAKYDVAACLEELAEFSVTAKSQGGPRRALEQADRLTQLYLSSRQKHFRALLRQIVFSLGLQAVSGSVLLGLGGWLVINGQLTLGQLVASELIVAVIVGAFAKLGKQMESFYDLLAAVDKLGHLFDLPIERQRGELPRRVTDAASLVFEDVSFAFGEHSRALDGFSLHVEPGELVAISGSPGSGKSLLLELAYGLREPLGGHIAIDGIDVRSFDLEALREQIALVRGIEVFTGTLAENVHLARDSVSLHDVRAALDDVGLLAEVTHFSDGLETELHPGDGPLSDSQARRLMLARAIAGRPRLLLIDGSLDGLPDELLPSVMAMLNRLRERCTIVITTGRGDIGRFCSRRRPLGAEPKESEEGDVWPSESEALALAS